MLDFGDSLSYFQDVEEGRVSVCQAIEKLAAKQRREMEKAEDPDYPFFFDPHEAENVAEFAGFLKHIKGELRGMPIELEPWQKMILALIFGWRRKDNGRRRFRKVYFQIARKNGKTTLAVIIVLYLFYKSEEGEFYSIATKRDQARIAFDIARSMVLGQSDLLAITTVHKHKFLKGDCFYQPMSAEDKTADGFNPFFVLVDEYHAHKNDDQVQVYQSGMGARPDPLILITTTAGFDLDGPCKEEYDRAKKILDQIFEDDSFLPIIYELDDKEKWEDPEEWPKANPNLGISVDLQYLKDQHNEATQKPNKKVDFLTKNCNVWVDSKEAWIGADVWKKNQGAVDRGPLIGRRCYGGIDLSAISDLTCFSLYFPPDEPGGKTRAIHRAYIPEDSIAQRAKYEHVQLRRWIRDEYLFPTPGEVVDHSYLIRDLTEAAEDYEIKEIGYDPALSASIVVPLEQEGFDLVTVPQGIFKFSPFVKDWEKDVRSGLILDEDPVMAWCLSNTVIKPDVNDNYKPLKEKKHKRIDLVISSIMAHSRMVANEATGPSGPSVLDIQMEIEEEEEQEEKEESGGTMKETTRVKKKTVLDVLMEME